MSNAFQSTGEKKFIEKAVDVVSAIEENLINNDLTVKRSLSISNKNILFLEDYSLSLIHI